MKDLLWFVGFLVAILAASFVFSPTGMRIHGSASPPVMPGDKPGLASVPFPAAPGSTGVAAGAGPEPTGAETRATAPARKRKKADTIVATVNGEPIRWAEIKAGIGNGLFGAMWEEACHDRRERLIAILVTRQYLQTQHVEVASAEVDSVIADLQQNPPPAGGCPCCSFNSLDAYLASNYLTLADLRAEVRNNLGMDRHVSALWEAEYPVGEKRRQLLETERPRVQRSYAKLSHIFFGTAQQPDFADDADAVRKRAREKALTACQKLQHGADFAKLARQCSEDTISRPKGGDLGCVLTSLFGKDAEESIQALTPGTYGQPVESPWGCHVFRREGLTDQDVLDVLKADARGQCLAERYDAMMKNAAVERFD